MMAQEKPYRPSRTFIPIKGMSALRHKQPFERHHAGNCETTATSILRLDVNANFAGGVFCKTHTAINERVFNFIDGTILAANGELRGLNSLDGRYSHLRPLGKFSCRPSRQSACAPDHCAVYQKDRPALK